MSNLRIVGLIIGVIGLGLTFLYYRGSRWRRTNFILFFLFNTALVLVSINPQLVNLVRDALLLKEHALGRIMALLILSNIFAWFFVFYINTKLDDVKHHHDLLVRAVSLKEEENREGHTLQLKPITVIIPAFNEADNLRDLLPQMPHSIKDLELGVLVVDDGSIDGTWRVVRELGYYCIRNIVNRGQGAASRLGYDLLKKHGVVVGVTMDADNQHRPEDIETLVGPILENRADLVIGSRMLGQREENSLAREMGIVIFSWLISRATGARLTDCSSGFKAFSKKWINAVVLKENQFQSTEVIIETVKKGLRIEEVPINIVQRKHGESKKGTDLRYGLNVAKAIFKAWWRTG